MFRGRDILRLPVIARNTGEKVGQVEDLVLDRQGAQVLGLVLGEKGILGGDARVVAWPVILVIGFDAVIIQAESTVTKASEVPEIKEVLERGFVLQGTRVATTEGRELGTIENFFFKRSTGALVGYELVGGENEQQPSGRAFMPAHPSFEAGKDYAFVDPSVADQIEDLGEALRSRRE